MVGVFYFPAEPSERKGGQISDMVLDNYAQLKEELMVCINSLQKIENHSDGIYAELKDKIQNNVFNLVVLGQFKRGKTSLINALLGAELLPTAVVPLTSIATILKYGESLRIQVFFNDGRVQEIDLDSLPQYVTEKGNPKNEKEVQEVVISYPSAYLRDGVRLIDTPGVGSVYEHNTDVAYQYLPKSDAALFLLSVDQPVSKEELNFLKEVREYSHRIFFLQNKADYVGLEDLKESMAFVKNILSESLGDEIKIFPVSAKWALQGKTSGSEELLKKSRLPEFENILNTFLMQEKGKVLLLSVTQNLLRLLSQASLKVELAMKSLATPLEELQKKIKLFEEKKEEILVEKDDFFLLLDGAVKQIIQEVLEKDTQAFRKDLSQKISDNLGSRYREYSGLPLKEMQRRMEEDLIAEVQQAFVTWRKLEEDKLSKTFEASCRRFISRIDEMVDTLLNFSAELFSVPFDIVKAEALWSSKSRFYYKFKDQPVGIEIMTSSLTLMLPKFIGEKVLLKKLREFIQEVIDRQAGRIVSDFRERLEQSKLSFRWEMLQRIEATLEGISKAIEKGLSQKSRDEETVEAQRTVLMEEEKKMSEIKGKLTQLHQKISA